MKKLRSILKSQATRTPYHAIALAHVIRFVFGARAAAARRLRRRDFFLDPTVKVTGWRSVSIGPNCAIGRHTWLNVNHRDSGGPTLEIGANSLIGHSNFFTVGRRIRLGEYTLTGPSCAFIGSSHVTSDPFRPYLTTGNTDAAIIDIGTNCHFGYGATVVGNVRIGFGSIIGAGTTILFDIPPLSLVVGTPARIIKRYSITKSEWVRVENYNDKEALPSEQEYLQHIRQTHPQLLMPLSAVASRLADI